jgi:hypothetical protein
VREREGGRETEREEREGERSNANERRKVNAFPCAGEGLFHPARIMQTDTGETIYPFNAVCVCVCMVFQKEWWWN